MVDRPKAVDSKTAILTAAERMIAERGVDVPLGDHPLSGSEDLRLIF